ncbi:MAG: AMP-binding protein, partial [Candidatus Aminicenantes bacterium]
MRHEKTLAGEAAAAASHFKKEGEYWLKKLSGELVKSSFPYDYKKNDTQKPKNESKPKPGANTVNFRFPDELSAKLFRLMKGSDSRLHMILVAELVLLLYKYNYTGNSDIIVGAPVLKQEVDQDFINTVLVLRVRLEDNITFKDLLLQVRKTVTEATENQNYPLEVLLSQLNMPVSPPGPHDDFPLFDVAVLLENIHHQSYLQHINPQMIFSFLRTGTAVQGKVEYNALFYRETTIDRIVNHLTTLMQHTLYNVDIPITSVELVTDREKAQLLVDFNRNGQAGYPADKTIPQLFAAQAEKSPDKIAVVYERECLTYGELEKKSNQLANYLYDEKNIRPDHCVGILIDKSIDLIVAIMGILKAGGSYVPIDPLFPEKLIKNIINDAAPGVVVSSKKYIRTLNRLQWDCPSFHTFLCTDSRHICLEEEEEKSELMGKKLWEYVGETATDEITGGGWLSSYTGDP